MLLWESVFVRNITIDRGFLFAGKPVMIVTEYMENGSLDSFLRVSNYINTCTAGGKEDKCILEVQIIKLLKNKNYL